MCACLLFFSKSSLCQRSPLPFSAWPCGTLGDSRACGWRARLDSCWWPALGGPLPSCSSWSSPQGLAASGQSRTLWGLIAAAQPPAATLRVTAREPQPEASLQDRLTKETRGLDLCVACELSQEEDLQHI